MSADRKIIRIDLAARQTREPSVIEALYEEREALLNELKDCKTAFALLLEIHGPTEITTHMHLNFDPQHTDIVEERLPDRSAVRYSLDKWTPT